MNATRRALTVLLLAAVAIALVLPAAPILARGAGHPPAPIGPSGRAAVAGSAAAPQGVRSPAELGPSPRALSLSWINVTNESTTPLPPGWFTEGTWDAADGYLLYYGGDNMVSTTYATTWAYSAGNWTNVSTLTNPGAVTGPALAYDPAAGQVVLLGGYASLSPFRYSNLTWLYSGGTWTSQPTNSSLTPRAAAAMTYDPELGGVLLFGGYDNQNAGASLLDDLWLYKGGAWQEVSTNAPPSARTWPGLAYDPSRQEAVMYSGTASGGSSCLGDTWTFSSGTWTHLAAGGTGTPPALCAASLVYDPQLSEVLLMGGYYYNGSTAYANGGVWAFNGTTWVPLAVTGLPNEHIYGVTAWDPSEEEIVLANGDGFPGVTDILTGPLTCESVTGPGTVEVGQPASFDANVTGGSPQRTYTWNFDDGNASTTGTPNAVTVYGATGTYTVNVTATDRTGASASGDTSIDVVAGPAAQIGPTPGIWDVGAPISFTGSMTGGHAPGTFSWKFGDGVTGSGDVVSHTYRSVGSFTVELTVADSVGGVGHAVISVDIIPGPAVGIVAAGIADTHVPFLVQGNVTGGLPSYRYFWSFGDGEQAATLSAVHEYTTPDTYTLNFSVLDSANASAGASLAVRVAAFPTLAINAPTGVIAGDPADFSAGTTGGQAPFTYLWALPNGTGATGANATFTFASAGTYELHLRAMDAVGAEVNATLNVTVLAQPNNSAPAFGTLGLLLIAGVVVAVVGAAVALLLRRRRPAEPSEEPPPEEPPEP
jgi:PKD repeat protein